ncbi:ATP-binding protein [Streptomyces europaeiscabiei]|uniref:ATP-binding protein n=1 Tax=Streptomyces europaeiscabiei TaxID=146819 RepID=UPI0029B14941|nr:ATP-binding protein [Streptomyces europaeiscabiei]MDX2765981.1 ATP-binding protein [Streptomyces europaeiscabiei]MDX2775232.1 ATP-binding protein [Streptomyces europaeiscabiei]MDX3670921.1 ATP-binding protein [Streptomyces europaeiscabiei]MDX3713712.1 ATP-binding protein [Streptomyces europaeiscabiei]MDX3847470.1 ATP-binding protein [Streptomyces europaeiscabiei]
MATVSPSWNYTLSLPRDPRSPGVGRATLRAVLAAHGLSELAPTAELLAAELLTNAHRHTAQEYALRVLEIGGRLRVGVWDRDWRVPVGFKEGAQPVDLDAERGRGLQLVRACSQDRGVSVLRDLGVSQGGKLLWVDCGPVR